ncbi:MAG: AIR synthase family protein [Promethearchaeota archaeon]|jgi:hydrogenase maturation factor
MRRNGNKFTLGKLKHEYLAELLSRIKGNDPRVILDSKIGEDAAVIDMPGDNYLVAKTDPITFATNHIGYYAVHINVNDVVCTGATPKWFQSTILLPSKVTTVDLIEKIFEDIYTACKSMNITVVGGHTEVTPNLERPIVIGSLLGEVEKHKLVSTSGAKPGDALILTKGIFIEGASIIGNEKEKELIRKKYDPEFIKVCKNFLFDPGISVYKEAMLAHENFKINSMHDPTEGGIATGIAEMAIASETGVLIEMSKINSCILPEPLILSSVFNLNPIGTLSSGSLLIAIDDNQSLKLITLLKKNNIDAKKIGEFVSKEEGLRVKNEDGKTLPLLYSETDELTKIL